MTKEKIYHLVVSGDSLTGMNEVACGIKPSEGMVGYFEASKTTCGACKRTKIYKQFLEEEKRG